jgi:DNA primase
MGLIPEEVIREIRDRTDIVAVIGQHVNLRKAGRNHKGLCPFHQEKTPSFNVNGDRGFFYCFGCQKKGDVFTFLMEYDGKSFVEAAEALAGQIGVEIPRTEEPEAVRRHRTERARMLELNKIATAFYCDLLASEAGAPGRAYLAERGIAGDVVDTFRLGFAPDDWRALTDHLKATGASMELAEKVGLIAPQPRAGGYYDRFRNRLMCPVIVPGSEVVGFSARLLPSPDDDRKGAKYINSPESAVYKKSKQLFGLHAARNAFRSVKRAVLVEGNFDVITMHQAGFAETVAPLGTALTDEQASLLVRFTDRVILLYDADKAGHAAALKALQVVMAAGADVYIATLPAGDDPDSLVKRDGAEAMQRLLDRAQLGVEYFAHEVFATTVRSSNGRTRTLRAAADIVKSVRDPIRRNLVVDQLALGMDIDPRLVWRAVGGQPAGGPPGRDERPATPRIQEDAPPPRLELDLLALLVDHPDLLEIAEERDLFSLLTDARLRDMYCAARQGQPVIAALPDAAPFIAQHVLSGAFASVTNPRHTLLELVGTLEKQRRRVRLAELQRRAEEAERRGDAELQRELVREILSTRREGN